MRLRSRLAALFCVFLSLVLYCEAVNPRLLKIPGESVEASALFEGGAPGILRLHIVANSDSAEDQRVKLLVRDALVKEFAPAGSLQGAEEIVLHDGGGVLETVNRVLKEQGCAYGAQLRFGVMPFPEKTYGNASFPAGDYEALRVELGAAGGKNWWCVLFPPLCLVDAGVQDIPGTDKLVFESDILKLMREWQKSAK